jgi:Bacterial archaeo-eukaryotic release factor family 10
MISRSEVDKLLSVQAREASVLSLYLNVPLEQAALRELPALAGDLFAQAAGTGNGSGALQGIGRQEQETVRGLLADRARDWLGHAVAIFTSSEVGLTEAIPLPAELPELAVLATRPHVRPLLLAIQRCAPYRVVVADRRHSWLFSIAGEDIRSAALHDAEEVRSHKFSGWYGLEAYSVNERIIGLHRQHLQATAALLDRAVRIGGAEPLVIGGHRDTIPQVLAALRPELREAFAGSFVADPATLTPGKVRELANGVVADWLTERDRALAAQLRQEPPDGLAAVGLTGCLAAAALHAVRLLAAPRDGLLPGYICRECGALSTNGEGCVHGAPSARPVPDLIEELAVAALADGAQVRTIDDPPGGVAAQLRFRLAAA